MVAIPSKSSFTGVPTTKGSFRSALDSLHDYLTGLLGEDGSPATARSKFGLGTAATLNAGVGAGNLVQLDSNGKLPPIGGENLTGIQSFPSGTRMLFQQTAAPIGWIKEGDSSFNNVALRIVTGTASSGGADLFTTVFGTGKETDGRALTVANLPPHSHTMTAAGGHSHTYAALGASSGTAVFKADSQFGTTRLGNKTTSGVGSHSHPIQNTGSGTEHTHPLLNLNLKYRDVIIATKS